MTSTALRALTVAALSAAITLTGTAITTQTAQAQDPAADGVQSDAERIGRSVTGPDGENCVIIAVNPDQLTCTVAAPVDIAPEPAPVAAPPVPVPAAVSAPVTQADQATTQADQTTQPAASGTQQPLADGAVPTVGPPAWAVLDRCLQLLKAMLPWLFGR